MLREPFTRLDSDAELRQLLLGYCRLGPGEIWKDPEAGHRVGCLDGESEEDVRSLAEGESAVCAVQDPPYNISVGKTSSSGLFYTSIGEYMDFSRKWIRATLSVLAPDSHFYLWTGADPRNGFQPLPDLILLLREFEELTPRNLITLRNQRGYGTQKNWMWVRQELLYYIRGKPGFTVVYTEIPKRLKGYYKDVGGKRLENSQRGLGDTLRAGNVWMDIQQVFYRMHENVPGAYAQKPLESIKRILLSGTRPGDTVLDSFAHSGTTLLAAEQSGRRCITLDRDPIFAELTIRRLEHYRRTGRPGWQCDNPFPEVDVRNRSRS